MVTSYAPSGGGVTSKQYATAAVLALSDGPPRPRLQRGRFKLAFITPVLKLFARNANRWRKFVIRDLNKPLTIKLTEFTILDTCQPAGSDLQLPYHSKEIFTK